MAPILAAAGFEVTAHETRARGHATQIVAAEDLSTYEAVVAVGGDGTVFEVLQVRAPLHALPLHCMRKGECL